MNFKIDTMKKIIFSLAFLVASFATYAQTGVGTTTPDASAVLDVASTTKGLLLPRMTTAQRNAIVSPATALMIFNTTTNAQETNTGTPAAPIWSAATNNIYTGDGTLAGNRTVTQGTNNLVFSGTGNTILNSGNVGIGAATPSNKLEVAQGTAGNSGIRMTNFPSVGALATNANGDIIAATAATIPNIYTTDGTLTASRVVNLGANNINFTGAGNKLFTGGNVQIDNGNQNTGTSNNALVFGAGASGEAIASKRNAGGNINGLDFYTSSSNRLSISNAGNVGIGTTTQTEKLEVAGNIKFSGALMPNNAAGATGQVLTSAGAGVAPTWANTAPAVTANTLTSSVNTITSTVNGVAATAPSVNSVANTSAANTLGTTINGVAGATVPIINSNATSINGSNQLVTTVNGVASTALTLPANNIYTTDGTIPAATNRTVTLGDRTTSRLNIAPAGEVSNIATLNVVGGNLAGGSTAGIAVSNNYIDNTSKNGILKVPQFLNSSPPVVVFLQDNNLTENNLYLGGFRSISQAAPSQIIMVVDGDTNLSNTSTASSLVAMTIMGVTGNVGIGTTTPNSKLAVVGLPIFATNAAATTGGLDIGDFYRTSTGVVMVRF